MTVAQVIIAVCLVAVSGLAGYGLGVLEKHIHDDDE